MKMTLIILALLVTGCTTDPSTTPPGPAPQDTATPMPPEGEPSFIISDWEASGCALPDQLVHLNVTILNEGDGAGSDPLHLTATNASGASAYVATYAFTLAPGASETYTFAFALPTGTYRLRATHDGAAEGSDLIVAPDCQPEN